MTSSSRSRDATGFTLFGSLVAVLALSVLVGLSGIPDVDDGSKGLELFETQLRDAVTYAKSLAHSNRKPHGIKIDAAADAFAVIDADGQLVLDPHSKLPYVVSLRAPDQARGLDILEVDFGAADSALLFDAERRPLARGIVRVRSRNLVASFVFDAATGGMSVQ